MAGIGFSLRSLGARGGYSGMLRVYGAAGLISCGPWLLSVFSMLAVGLVGKHLVSETTVLERFQVCVTWLFALSLVASGPLQLQLTRFIADRTYLSASDEIVPNLLGALSAMSALSALLALGLSPWLASEPLAFRVLVGTAFVTLCNVWLVVGVLTGLRRHAQVLGVFGLGYLVTVLGSLLLAPYGELGLLLGFSIGQAVLLVTGLRAVTSELPASSAVGWQFLARRELKPDLLLIGLFYNLSIWIDKALFWFDPSTSRPIIGALRGSDVYDLPIFLAYLTIVPGMAVFLVRVETDFAERHAKFYAAVRDGASLRRLEQLSLAMTDAARRSITDLLIVQGLTVLACFGVGPFLLRMFGLSPLHLPLFYVDAIGVALQVLLLTATSILFYLDRRREVAALTCILFATNVIGTWITRDLGPEYYGYGFALAMAATSIAALIVLERLLRDLVRDTFMLQPVTS